MTDLGQPLVLLTGATGYVGGRLLPVLERAGVRVRCLARRPDYLAGRVGATTEVVRGDCLDADSLAPAFAGVHTAYYLVHSLGARGSFEEQDVRAARHVAHAARAAGVSRIVYLGGLGDAGEGLSAHLRSRRETGTVLRSTGVPVIEFQASIILGSGSLSYELLRALVERLPVMLCPSWVRTPTQPIAIEDVITYLRSALDLPAGPSQVFQIGGADVTSYAGILREYARQRGLRRMLVPVPVLTPYLSSLWLGLTTPIYARVGRKLVESLRNATVVRDTSSLRTFPVRPMGLAAALARAQISEDRAIAATRWNDALSATAEPPSYGGVRFGSRLVDSRAITVPVPPEAAFAPIRRIGGGLAGLTAATYLADRGFSVTLFEAKHHLGGKCSSWPTALENGERVQAEHGFHAFFRQYYNLRRLLAHVGVASRLRAIDDYLIVGEDGTRYSFRHVATTPGMNLISLAWNGVYRLGPVVLGGAGSRMESFLRYERDATFAEYDEMSFDAWAKAGMLPRSLELLFTTFARAFFADRERMSMAELIKGFHFYYLSNDCGLLYDHLTVDHEPGLIAPLMEHLEQHGARIELATPVGSLEKAGAGFELQGRFFDDVVLATSVPGTRAIVSGARSLAQSELARRVETLKTGQRYAVLRLWLDRDVGADWPVFVITERRRLLDAVAFVHRAQSTAGAWAAERSGAVVELHCYAVPDALADDTLRDALMRDLAHFRPGIAQARILGENLEIGRDMTAFHTGLFANRPEVDNGVEGLYLAGDWVKLPYPAMLMEAACMSGLLSANAILRRHGLREEPVYTVPLRGLLAQRARAQRSAG